MGEIRELKPIVHSGLQPQLPIKKKNGFCAHDRVEVDEDERCLRCSKCNAFVDAYDYVLSLAREERNFFYSLSDLQKTIVAKRLEKEELERQVANLKAAKRRASNINQ